MESNNKLFEIDNTLSKSANINYLNLNNCMNLISLR